MMVEEIDDFIAFSWKKEDNCAAPLNKTMQQVDLQLETQRRPIKAFGFDLSNTAGHQAWMC